MIPVIICGHFLAPSFSAGARSLRDPFYLLFPACSFSSSSSSPRRRRDSFLYRLFPRCHFCSSRAATRSRWMRNHPRCNHQPVFPDKEQSTSVLSHCHRGNYQLGSPLPAQHFCRPADRDRERGKRLDVPPSRFSPRRERASSSM